MDASFAACIKEYRIAAAKRFLSTSESTNNSTTHDLNDRQLLGQNDPYQRTQVPGLEEYLHNAAVAYAHAKAQVKPKPKQRYVTEALGHGTPVEFLHPTLRRERWLRLQSERKHFVRALQQPPIPDFVLPCGIPRDVLQTAATRFLSYKRFCQQKAVKPLSEYMLGRRLVDESIELLDILTDPGFSVHIKRCEDVLTAGGNVIVARCREIQTYDDFEDVRKRYVGRPDELYRRKTARKYATWRRTREEEERILQESELKAEREMKRRRGHDQLLTSRPNGDSSFAPFLYELGNNTYAYSSKITKAPKLRKLMIDKYSEQDNPEPNQFQKTQQAAEMDFSFRGRVMNRFC